MSNRTGARCEAAPASLAPIRGRALRTLGCFMAGLLLDRLFDENAGARTRPRCGRAQPRNEARPLPVELTTLTDGGQPAGRVAAEIATFVSAARESLDLALYDVRLETEAGALVLASLLAAQQRGVRVRLLYNVDHPGPIPVPPPPETRPEAIEALPVETRGIAGIPDLMHHKFCVRDGRDVWTGSMNWTEDSWTRQENVVVRVLGAERLAFAFRLAFEELWERGTVERTGTVEPRPVALDGGITRPSVVHARSRRRALAPRREAPRSCAPADPHRVAGADRRPDPRHPRRGRQRAPLRRRGRRRRHAVRRRLPSVGAKRRQRLEDPAARHDRHRRRVLREAVDAVVARRRPGLHAREGRGRRRRVVRRLVQLLALGRAERRERPRDRGSRDGRRPRRLRRRRSQAGTRSRHRPPSARVAEHAGLRPVRENPGA